MANAAVSLEELINDLGNAADSRVFRETVADEPLYKWLPRLLPKVIPPRILHKYPHAIYTEEFWRERLIDLEGAVSAREVFKNV
jgi:hypothetical protein